jgi:hypothetical protein
MLKGINNPHVLLRIAADQPCNRPEPDKSALGILTSLWNTDKHRALHLITVLTEIQEIVVAPNGAVELEQLEVMDKGTRIADGDIVAQWRVKAGSVGDVKFIATVATSVGFAETDPPVLNGAEVVPILQQAHNYVANLLKDAEAWFV